MRYELKIGQRKVALEAETSGEEGHVQVTIGDEAHDIQYKTPYENCYHVVMDGKAALIHVVSGDNGKYVFVNGRQYLVQDMAKGVPARRGRKRSEDLPDKVTPPMPSVVVRIMVKEGDLVERGQGLVVVSAMKMETTLKAPYKGRVTKINTSPDAKVSPGDILVEIEKEVSEDE